MLRTGLASSAAIGSECRNATKPGTVFTLQTFASLGSRAAIDKLGLSGQVPPRVFRSPAASFAMQRDQRDVPALESPATVASGRNKRSADDDKAMNP